MDQNVTRFGRLKIGVVIGGGSVVIFMGREHWNKSFNRWKTNRVAR